jgi:hypothetical protein
MRSKNTGLVLAARAVACTWAIACTGVTPLDEAPGPDAGGGVSSGTGDASADGTPTPQGPPAISYLGRFDTRDAAGPKASWPGSRVVIRFEGTDLTVRLDDQLAADKPGPSEWDATIDGVLQPKFTLVRGPQDYVVAKGLAPGVHVVELYKRSESQVGVTQLLGVDYHGGKLLAPPPAPARRIEIIGDSAATAFGVDGSGPTCPGANDAAKYESFRESWGAILGTTFGADVHGTSYSGKGLLKNIWRPDTEVMPRLFTRANPEDDASTFDFSSWQPHVVVVMIGGNDFDVGQPVDDEPATLDAFTTAYESFVATLRGAYPDAHLYLAPSPTLSDDQPLGRSSRTNVKAAIAAVVSSRSSAGDARVHAAEPAVAASAEITGCDGHGGPAFHVRVAQELAASIGPTVGWK